MAIITWLGGTSTNAGTDANWVGGSAPGTGDTVYFNSASALVYQPIFITNSTFKAFHIGSSQRAASGPKIHTNITITLTGDSNGEHLIIEEAESLEASSGAIIKFTGAVDSDKTYIKFNAGTGLDNTDIGMFINSASRTNMTFKFEPGTNINLELANGVYPNITGVAGSDTCTLSPTAPLNTVSSTSYPTVDILNLTLDANFKIKPARQTEADFSKIFRLEGNLHINNDTFFWGNSTVEFTPVHAISSFPVTGVYKSSTNYVFGNASTKAFNAKYNKIVINYAASKYFTLPASSILLCNHLNISSGGRLYGPNTTAIEGAEIHSIQRPTIEGDWNFTQVADGVYRTRKTLLPQQEYHDLLSSNRSNYGAANNVLAINSAGTGLEWSATAGGGAGTTYDLLVPDSTTAIRLDPSAGDNDDITLTGGTNVTITRNSATQLTFSSTDTNTVYTHPNHSGHVTSSADGATTIAEDVITKDMLVDRCNNTRSDYFGKWSNVYWYI